MHDRNYPLLFLFLLVVFNACRKKTLDEKFLKYSISVHAVDGFMKDHSLDTVYPSNYLMAYPGSWWEYTNSKDSSERYYCDAWEEVLLYDRIISDGLPFIVERKKVLPHTSFGLIYKNYRVRSYPETRKHRLDTLLYPTPIVIRDISRNHVIAPGPGRTWSSSDKIWVETIPNLVVRGKTYYDIVLTRHVNSYATKIGNPVFKDVSSYYAKNVGLIKEVRGGIDFGLKDSIELVSYFIAPH